MNETITRLQKLLEANPEPQLKDGAGIYVSRAIDGKIRRQAIEDCLKVVRECGAKK